MAMKTSIPVTFLFNDFCTGNMAQTRKEPIQSVVLDGPPHERGITHGEHFADEIKQNVRTYLDRFQYHGANEKIVREKAQEFLSLIEENERKYFTEMKGIAEGSGVPLEDITILNARWEVMYSAFADTADEIQETDGCTAFGVQPEVTDNSHTYMGQNWDWIPSLEIFIMDIQREDGPNMIAMTEAGIVGGKIGVNEHGIGVTVNGLISEKDGEDPYRRPMHVRMREVLNAERLDRAVKPLITEDRAISANVMLGHAKGEFINLELTPEREIYSHPEDGVLTHANHFETNDVNSKFETLLPDTLCRAPRVQRLLSNKINDIDVDVLSDVLSDHFGKPASVCRHTDETVSEQEQYRTNGSFIIDLSERQLFATQGPPCSSDYRPFSVAT
jgi:isopenicillin-N N-acyltransferase-like protein